MAKAVQQASTAGSKAHCGVQAPFYSVSIYDPSTHHVPSPVPDSVTAQMTTHDNDSGINMSTQFGLLMGSL